MHHVNFLQPRHRGLQHFLLPEYNENSGKCISITLSTHVETVVKLSLKKDTPKIEVTMEPNEESNIADAVVLVPDSEELSTIGPAYAAGLQLGVWDESIFGKLNRVSYKLDMEVNKREQKYARWKKAVASVITNKKFI